MDETLEQWVAKRTQYWHAKPDFASLGPTRQALWEARRARVSAGQPLNYVPRKKEAEGEA